MPSNCLYLTGRQIKMCSAVDGSLVLSLDELSLACQGNYQTCKIYQSYQRKGTKTPLRDYERSYLAPKA